MAPKKKEKGAKKDQNGKEIKNASPAELPAVQWTFLCLTILLVLLATATSFLCFMEWRKTRSVRSAFGLMRQAVIEEYDNLLNSPTDVILDTVKKEAKNVIDLENRISRVEFKIKEVIALFRNDWIQGVGTLFYLSHNEFSQPQCTTNCNSLNATLAIIKDRDKENFLEKTLHLRRGRHWIGVTQAPNSHWYHADGTVVDVGFWGTFIEIGAKCVCLAMPCWNEYRCWAKIVCSSMGRCLCEKGPENIWAL